MTQRSFLRSLCVLAVLGAATTSGCGSGSQLEGETGTVNGRVSYNGQPLPVGSNVVMIHRGQGLVATGTTDANGNFSLQMRGGNKILTGEYALGISPPSADVQGNESMDVTADIAEESTWTAIPEKYLTPETSGEILTVTTGSNDLQIELKD